jgi:hypothetical protein
MARGLSESETKDCAGSEQRLERIATAFDRKRDRLIRGATESTQRIPKEND